MFSFELSNVDGGGTAFPNIGRVVYPEKGSLVFWYNMHENGTYNEDSIHAFCPVLYGVRSSKKLKKLLLLYIVSIHLEFKNVLLF